MPSRILHRELKVRTCGHGDAIDITPLIEGELKGIKNGLVNIYTPEERIALITIEYEPRILDDLRRYIKEYLKICENLVPAILGRSLDIPLVNGRLRLGTWQQVVLLELGTSSREVSVYVTIICEDP